MWPIADVPLLLLAPMDGYTDRAFRRFIKRIEPRTVVFTEFHSALELARKPALAEKWFPYDSAEQPLVAQLYGKDPDAFAEAAHVAEAKGAAGIDINMGCPAKKVVAHQHGSALMKNIDLACQIVAEVKARVQIPVSVKTRLGWDDDELLIPFALRLQSVGLDAITIHGRTYAQKFQGDAQWGGIYALKECLQIPVFGNGDVRSPADAMQKLGILDGVMVGRAAIEQPYVMRAIAGALYGETGGADAVGEPLDDWLFLVDQTFALGQELAMARRMRKYMVRLADRLLPDDQNARQMSRHAANREAVVDFFEMLAEQNAFDSFRFEKKLQSIVV